jgi:hypothetical protein
MFARVVAAVKHMPRRKVDELSTRVCTFKARSQQHHQLQHFSRNLACQRLQGDVHELTCFLRNAQVLQRSNRMRARFAIDAAGSRLHRFRVRQGTQRAEHENEVNSPPKEQ